MGVIWPVYLDHTASYLCMGSHFAFASCCRCVARVERSRQSLNMCQALLLKMKKPCKNIPEFQKVWRCRCTSLWVSAAATRFSNPAVSSTVPPSTQMNEMKIKMPRNNLSEGKGWMEKQRHCLASVSCNSRCCLSQSSGRISLLNISAPFISANLANILAIILTLPANISVFILASPANILALYHTRCICSMSQHLNACLPPNLLSASNAGQGGIILWPGTVNYQK